jgi:hypothetical protein
MKAVVSDQWSVVSYWLSELPSLIIKGQVTKAKHLTTDH